MQLACMRRVVHVYRMYGTRAKYCISIQDLVLHVFERYCTVQMIRFGRGQVVTEVRGTANVAAAAAGTVVRRLKFDKHVGFVQMDTISYYGNAVVERPRTR